MPKSANSRWHGMYATSIYWTWKGMLRRCSNPNAIDWKYYGARGIYVVKRWHKFINFYNDMGDRPPGLQLDRRNNNGPYSPKNCRWVTPKVNANNRRRKKGLYD